MYQPPVMKSLIILLCASILTACTGLGGLSHRQIKVLQKEGFVYTDEGWALAMPSRLLFATDQYTLQTEQQNSISELSQKLHAIKLDKLLIQGHTDNVGNEQYNLNLSQRRAHSVAEIIIRNGFQQDNIKIVGYGSSKPVASNNTEAGRSENRRVAIVIVP